MCMHNGMCVHMRVLGALRKVLSSLLMQLLEEEGSSRAEGGRVTGHAGVWDPVPEKGWALSGGTKALVGAL